MSRRHPRFRNAFTLIELIVVVIVLGLLMAVALPNFFGASTAAQDSAARQYLTLSYKDLKAAIAQNDGAAVSAASAVSALTSSEPQLGFISSAAASAANGGTKTVYVEQTATGYKLGIHSASSALITLTADRSTGYAPVFTGGAGGSVVVVSAPVNSGGLPLISGTIQVGQTLSATAGIWSGSPTGYSYQWQHSADSGSTWTSASGSGATTAAYTLVVADANATLRVSVTASNSGGSATASSTATSAVPSVVTAVQAADNHTCALLSDRTIKCWGDNTYGQLGNGTTTNSSTPVAVSGISTATTLGGGYNRSCALLADGTVKCWGLNSVGQLGDGTTTNSSTPVTVMASSGVPLIAIAVGVGDSQACAVLSGGTVKCWGYNASGQLGDGTTTNRSTPVTISGLTASAVATGGYHTCALLSDGTVKCWGQNYSGQLGNGTTTDSLTPVAVSGLTAVAVATGAFHTCALLSGGTVKCWGYNNNGQLGNGTTTDQHTPVATSSLGGTATAVAGGQDHSCALLSDATVKCWGTNADGELGNGSAPTNSSTPVAVSSLSGATAITNGSYYTCAVLAAGTLKCWGYNASGQLGDGTTTSHSTPVAVVGLP